MPSGGYDLKVVLKYVGTARFLFYHQSEKVEKNIVIQIMHFT